MQKLYKKIVMVVTSLCVIFALSACAPQKKLARDLTAYSQRLQDFTHLSLPEIDNNYALNPPNKLELRITIPPLNINLREFYAFQQCSLNQLIAQRNTVLGKTQLPSTRFAYEVQLINELTTCLKRLKDTQSNANLAAKLQSWLQVKQTHLPDAWANLITQSSETYSHVSSANGFIRGTSHDNLQATKQGLGFLINSLQNSRFNLSELELHLQELGHSPLLAKMWRTQLMLKVQLDNISVLLMKYLQQNTCKSLQQKNDIKIMRNIFTLFFADKIQPIVSELNKYQYQLLPLLNALSEHPRLPITFRQYIKQHSQHTYTNYKESFDQHITLWQQIFARCD